MNWDEDCKSGVDITDKGKRLPMEGIPSVLERWRGG